MESTNGAKHAAAACGQEREGKGVKKRSGVASPYIGWGEQKDLLSLLQETFLKSY